MLIGTKNFDPRKFDADLFFLLQVENILKEVSAPPAVQKQVFTECGIYGTVRLPSNQTYKP